MLYHKKIYVALESKANHVTKMNGKKTNGIHFLLAEGFNEGSRSINLTKLVYQDLMLLRLLFKKMFEKHSLQDLCDLV